MKLTFECKLTMIEYISDDEIERIRTTKEVAEDLVKYITWQISSAGEVSITDATLTKEEEK